MRVVLVAGTTETAEVPERMEAGDDPARMGPAPGADLDSVTHGEGILAPVVPVSPSG